MEYVRVSPEEKTQGKKNLLYCQMEILTIMKRYQQYKKLRSYELALKTALKRKVNEINEEMKILDKMVPRVRHERHEEPVKKETHKEVKKEVKPIPKEKRSALEIEIDEIKKRIDSLT